MDVTGLAEAASQPDEVQVTADLKVPVASIPAQINLKLVAWRDRHHDHGTKDGVDLGYLLDGWTHEPLADAVWADEDAISWAEYDPHRAAAYKLGREAGALLGSQARKAVLAVLEDPRSRDHLVRSLGIRESTQRLAAWRAGFESTL